MGCSHPPSFCCPIGAREKIGRDGEKTKKKKTIIRLPLMAPGSTRHTATTLRWLLSHGHRPRLSNKRTGVFLFLFDVRVFTMIPAHDCSACGQRRPAPKALFEHAHNRTGPGPWKILIHPSLGCYRPPDRPKPPSGTRAWRPTHESHRYYALLNRRAIGKVQWRITSEWRKRCTHTVKQPNRPLAFSLWWYGPSALLPLH